MTGQRPFKGDTTMAVLTALATKDPTPPHEVSEIPEPLSDLILRLLAKEPTNRPRTACDVIEELAEIEQDLGKPEKAKRITATTPSQDKSAVSRDAKRSADLDKSSPTGQAAMAGKRLAKTQKLLPLDEAPRPPWRKTLLIAVGLLGCVLALAGGIYYVVTDDGTIEIRTEDERAQVSLLKNGQEIEILDGTNNKTWAVRTGTYTVRLKDDPGGLEIVMPDTFEMKRNGKQIVTIRKLKGCRPTRKRPRRRAGNAVPANPPLPKPEAKVGPVHRRAGKGLEWVLSKGGWVLLGPAKLPEKGIRRQQAVRAKCRVPRRCNGRLGRARHPCERRRSQEPGPPPLRQGGPSASRGSPIGDAGLAELAKCPALKGITNLVLTQTKITDAGLQHLTAFPNLELLAVGNENYGGAGNNQINGSGFKYVAQLKKLRAFKADGCLLISGSMAALQFLKLTSLFARTQVLATMTWTPSRA